MSNDLKYRIQEDMKITVRAKEKERLSTIRLLLAAIKQHEIDDRPKELDSKGLEDKDVIKIIEKMITQRRESISQYKNGNRPDLAERERREIEVLEDYLPEAMNESEIDALIQEAIEETKANLIKDMGKVMVFLREKLGDRRIDNMSAVSAKVKRYLV
ncbi:MAG: GatB/YqeY domain-containing protein [Coxiella endosymbiont of Haemaphysalis qinghaiensis]